MLTYCKRCVMPDTKPDLHLDETGECNACRSYEARKAVDDARMKHATAWASKIPGIAVEWGD